MATTHIKKPLINEQIRGKEFRVVDQNHEFLGILSRETAFAKAKELGLDLILINPGVPPVCRIMDVGKYLYEESKKHKHVANHKEKELSLSVNIGQHDFDTRVRQSREFLEKGHPVRVVLAFTSRESAHPELGFDVVNKFLTTLSDCAKHTPPKRAGNKVFTTLQPAKK
jgi:translation initiation factor IF-3